MAKLSAHKPTKLPVQINYEIYWLRRGLLLLAPAPPPLLQIYIKRALITRDDEDDYALIVMVLVFVQNGMERAKFATGEFKRVITMAFRARAPSWLRLGNQPATLWLADWRWNNM